MSEIHEFIKKCPYLVWYVRDLDGIGDRSIVEHVLNYSNWDDVQEMFRIMGIDHAAAVFRKWAHVPRTNYRHNVTNYFDRYFFKYANPA